MQVEIKPRWRQDSPLYNKNWKLYIFSLVFENVNQKNSNINLEHLLVTFFKQ